MGKVHRIKKHFWRIVSQKPMPTGYRYLAKTSAYVYVGQRMYERSQFIMRYSSDRAYKGLMNQLMREYDKSGG